jgi:hypothetical protein
MKEDNEMRLRREKLIRDIILCEPVTSRGRESRDDLGLKDILDEKLFYGTSTTESIYVKPTFASSTIDVIDGNTGESIVGYPYTISAEKFREKQVKLAEFNDKFVSDSENQSLLFMVGTPGNGKSVEIHHKIKNPMRNGEPIKSDFVIYELDNTHDEIRQDGFVFSTPVDDNPLWLIIISLLEKIYELVEKYADIVSQIGSRYNELIIGKGIQTDEESNFFESILSFRTNEKKTHKKLYESMKTLVDDEELNKREVLPVKSIKNLLRVTIDLCYCIEPKKKHYIVFDNIEAFIKLGERFIPIHNNTIAAINTYISSVMDNVSNQYKRIKEGESWRAFKIILVLRRTSAYLIVKSVAHNAAAILKRGNDYTGHVDIWRVWKKKEKLIWEPYLKKHYNSIEYERIIWILNKIMADTPSAYGTSFQGMIATMMNMGIRRNANAQAHIVIAVHGYLSDGDNRHINYEQFQSLLGVYDTSRFMFRRALLNIEYKWMIASLAAEDRFNKLKLGTILDKDDERGKDTSKAFINYKKVQLPSDSIHITYVWRILSYLSIPDSSTIPIRGTNYETDMYATISPYNLMQSVFLLPNGQLSPYYSNYSKIEEYFLTLANVLAALSDFSNEETKTAPMLVLDMDDTRMEARDTASELAIILKEIWEAGEKESTDSGKYSRSKYSIRLTDSGYSFVRHILPSFTFFEAQYCNEEFPLFFLRDIKRIKSVIDNVYNVANALCNRYEDATDKFCGEKQILKNTNYLNRCGTNRTTFRKRVKEMHTEYLKLYQDFLNENWKTLGFDATTQGNDLFWDKETKDNENHEEYFISKYIDRYKKWSTDKKCF